MKRFIIYLSETYTTRVHLEKIDQEEDCTQKHKSKALKRKIFFLMKEKFNNEEEKTRIKENNAKDTFFCWW